MTGGAGFIGSHIVDSLLSEGHRVKVLDNLYSGNVENLKGHEDNPSLEFISGDLRNKEDVVKAVRGIDAVFHEAAITSVPASVKEPELTREVNVEGTVSLLEESLDEGVEKFIFASSCAVYGEVESVPVSEGAPLKPASPYAESKINGERQVLRRLERGNTEPIIFRYFNVYGPGQSGGRYAGVITKFLERLENDKPPVIYGDGKQTRDFVFIDDIVRANLLALENGSFEVPIFNLGTGESVSVNELCGILLEITGKTDLEPVYEEARSGDIRHSRADLSRVKKELGYSPEFTLRRGLKRLILEGCFDLDVYN